MALGACNMIGSFFQAYPVTGSFSRSAVNASCYVQTLIGGVIAGGVVILAFEELTKMLFYVPQACLSAIVIVAVLSIIDYKVRVREAVLGMDVLIPRRSRCTSGECRSLTSSPTSHVLSACCFSASSTWM